MKKRLNLAVLLSGGGTTLQNLIQWRDAGRLKADVGLVVSSRADAKGLGVAARAGIGTEVVAAKDYLNLNAREGERIHDWHRMSEAIDKLLIPGGFDLVCMAGFLSRYFIPERYYGKVVNIHPALIPMFCGQDMYGSKVHEAVVASGVRVSGCTVHFANNNYDAGPIILQRACPVYDSDTAIDVAMRVFAEECIAYPEVINLIADGRVRLSSSGRALVDRDREIERFS